MDEYKKWLHSPVTWVLIITVYELVAFSVFLFLNLRSLEPYRQAFFFVPPVLVLALLFFHFFTLPIPDSDDDTATAEKERIRTDLIKYAFVFMSVAVALAVVPFFLFTQVPSVETHPIAFFTGCSLDRDPGTELACPMVRPKPPIGESEEAGEQNDNSSAQDRQSQPQWVINIGGLATLCGSDVDNKKVFCVQGGLVVPVYFLILGLFGGAVSLTRRVPEYQKRSTPGYVGTPEAPAIDIAELREYLVFQIIQFASAPFIAVVAYNFIDPTQPLYAVPLGFAAGFASETILLMIRAVLEKINPIGTPPPQNGYLSGTVIDSQSRQGISDVKVTLVSTDTTVTTDGNGQYLLVDIPTGSQAIRAEDKQGRAKFQQVTVRAGKVGISHIELP